MKSERLRHIHGESGDVSDAWHTFDELYEHRYALFAALAHLCRPWAWKSRFHHDGSMDEGFFIAGLTLPTGDMTYHLPLILWDRLRVREHELAPPWDGHTSHDVLYRIWAFTAGMRL